VILSYAISPLLLFKIIYHLLSSDKAKRVCKNIAITLIIICSVTFSLISFLDRNIYYEPRLSYKFDFNPQKFIYENAEYEDFVFVTPEQLDMAYPPAYSRKLTHSIKDTSVLYERVSNLDDRANICILYVKNPEKPLTQITDEIFKMMNKMNLIYQDEDYEYYRCTKEEYLLILDEIGLGLAK
jgi:hypothetical protein